MPPNRFLTVPHFAGPKIVEVDNLASAGLSGKERVRIDQGEGLGPDRLAGAALPMIKGTKLADFLGTVSPVFVVSERAQELFKSQGLGADDLELWPFQLLDRKKNPRPERYAVAHPIRRIDCLIPDRCDAKLWTNPVSNESKWMVESVAIDETKIPPEVRLFRLGESPRIILMRSDLFQAIQDAGLTGLVSKELGQPLMDI